MKRICILLLISSLTISCTKTKRDIALAPEMNAEIEALLEELQSIAGSFPDAPIEPSWSLDPAPVFDKENATSTDNVIVGSERSISNFDSDLSLAGDSFRLIYYGPSRLLSERFLSEPAPEGYEEELNSLIERPYIVAYRVVSHQKPVLSDEDTYSGGQTKIRFALYDRSREAWHCAFEASSSPTGLVEFTSKEAYVTRDAGFHILEQVREDLKNQMETKLAEASGGQF
ncbi:MAG: hypothetical protein AAF236_04845, partial [Verrucomicrobiota bacterium]